MQFQLSSWFGGGGGGLEAMEEQRLQSKGDGWPGITSKAVGIKATPPNNQHCHIDYQLIYQLCMALCVCVRACVGVHNH